MILPRAINIKVQRIPIMAEMRVLLHIKSEIFRGEIVILRSVPIFFSFRISSKTTLQIKRRNMTAMAGRI